MCNSSLVLACMRDSQVAELAASKTELEVCSNGPQPPRLTRPTSLLAWHAARCDQRAGSAILAAAVARQSVWLRTGGTGTHLSSSPLHLSRSLRSR